MPLFTQGTWGNLLGPLSTVDFGITERLGLGAPNPRVVSQGAAAYQPVRQAASPPAPSTNRSILGQQSSFVGPTYSGPQTSAPTGGGNAQAPVQGPIGQDQLQQNVFNQQDAGNSQIDADYENYINTLNTQEQGVRSEAGIAEEKSRNAATAQQTAIGRERDVANQGFAEQTQNVQTSRQNALQQARDLYRQLQQQNIAQLSGAGLSSSSVAESLAENLGRDTARRIFGINNSAEQVVQNIDKEKTNINNYLQEKLTNVQNDLATRINEIQSSLSNALSQINNTKNVAASDRAAARQNILLQTQQAITDLQIRAQSFQQNLQQQMASRAQALADYQNKISTEQQQYQQELPQILDLMRNNGISIPGMQQETQQPTGGFITPRAANTEEDIYAQFGL